MALHVSITQQVLPELTLLMPEGVPPKSLLSYSLSVVWKIQSQTRDEIYVVFLTL